MHKRFISFVTISWLGWWLLNSTLTMFRYTEVYQLFLPQKMGKFITSSYWEKYWPMSGIQELLGPVDEDKVYLMADSYDVQYFKFYIHPHLPQRLDHPFSPTKGHYFSISGSYKNETIDNQLTKHCQLRRELKKYKLFTC